MSGGAGTDTADYSGAASGVTVSLDDIANDGLPSEGDNVGRAGGVEQLVGSPYDDLLIGGPNADVITRGGSQDEIYAMGGNDTIYAFDGSTDIIDGGDDIDAATLDRSDYVVNVEVLT